MAHIFNSLSRGLFGGCVGSLFQGYSATRSRTIAGGRLPMGAFTETSFTWYNPTYSLPNRPHVGSLGCKYGYKPVTSS